MDGIKLPAEIERDNLNVRMDRIERMIDLLIEQLSTEPDCVDEAKDDNKLLGVREASIYYRVSPKTIYNWVYMRKIPFRKLNGKLLFDVDDFKNYRK